MPCWWAGAAPLLCLKPLRWELPYHFIWAEWELRDLDVSSCSLPSFHQNGFQFAGSCVRKRRKSELQFLEGNTHFIDTKLWNEESCQASGFLIKPLCLLFCSALCLDHFSLLVRRGKGRRSGRSNKLGVGRPGLEYLSEPQNCSATWAGRARSLRHLAKRWWDRNGRMLGTVLLKVNFQR